MGGGVIRAARLAIAAWLLCGSLFAHGADKYHVFVRFLEAQQFFIDVNLDPDELLTSLKQPRAPSAAERDQRVAQAASSEFARHITVLFDDRPVAFESRYTPPTGATSGDQSILLVMPATIRLTGSIPESARTFRWAYDLAVGPYPVQLQDSRGEERIVWLDGRQTTPPIEIARFLPPTRTAVIKQYLALGFTHILPKGLDHILFVLGLFLFSTRLRPILLQITAFTVAHSITLGLTIYGVFSLSPRIVEPLIALSIAYVAIENILTTDLRPSRVALVFCFGLLHGMGFAGVLRQLGLPRSEFLTALVTFNLGVEGGQLSVLIAAYLAIGLWYNQKDWYRKRIVIPASAVIAAVGLYWTVTRLWR